MTVYFEATGVVANARLGPLLPDDWVDVTTKDGNKSQKQDIDTTIVPHFLWENAPRQATKAYRDHVKVYSHLPNGSTTLDSKWVLGRLFEEEQGSNNPLLATCETHCFIGPEGFQEFAQRMNLLKTGDCVDSDKEEAVNETFEFCDILKRNDDSMSTSSSILPCPAAGAATTTKTLPRPNLWVVKDATANGAGGVWVVGRDNARTFCQEGPLYKEHKYVAQQYVWPFVVFDGKKCHVRVYSTITYDGRAFVHERAFLHVANERFTLQTNSSSNTGPFDDCVHITNCCANSHDDDKFAGEILADFTTTTTSHRDGQTVLPLADFFPSVQATVSSIATRAFPFMEGGQRNNGFEYCGMDFMLSYDEKGTPLAYLLEINAPPSQDTATGLPHAENLHNDVLRDWMTFWVIPRIVGSDSTTILGGWKCVHNPNEVVIDEIMNQSIDKDDLILPSKATILNKIRWAIFEKKAQRRDALQQRQDPDEQIIMIPTDADDKGTQQPTMFDNDGDRIAPSCIVQPHQISRFARSHFPYFSLQQSQIFFESAGGAQVPQSVMDCMTHSLKCRHRSAIGAKTKAAARATIKVLFGAKNDGTVVFGQNATCLLASLAQRYVQYKLISAEDEVVISTENHKANFDPWLTAATAVGATIKLWSPSLKIRLARNERTPLGYERSSYLEELVTPRTRIVAIPHVSNVLGTVRPMKKLANTIKWQSKGNAHIVVDGVAAVPHVFPGFDTELGPVDWYVVSMHKLFGPHLGVLLARRGAAVENLASAVRSTSPGIIDEEECLLSMMERGTANIEGCAGVVGLGLYFKSLANGNFSADEGSNNSSPLRSSVAGDEVVEGQQFIDSVVISSEEVKLAFDMIRVVEVKLAKLLIMGLCRSPRVRLLQSGNQDGAFTRLPTVTFCHDDIPSREILNVCSKNGIICRCGFFLNTPFFRSDFGISDPCGAVRVSLAHYNTTDEVGKLLKTLEIMPGW